MLARLRRLALAAPFALATLAAAPTAAEAFCGFYVGGAGAKLFNNATVVVLMRDGTTTALSMQNNYQGPPERFAMVVPVPVVLQKEDVKTLPMGIFDRVDRLAAPRLVEYWEEDPCAYERYYARPAAKGAPRPKPTEVAGAPGGGKVQVLAQFTVGEYEIVILGADDSLALDTWLRKESYAIPEGAEPILRPYVQAGMKFFVAKVDPKKVRFEGGQAMLSPLRFHYASETFNLPVRLGLVNSAGTQDLIVHVLARGQRYEVANYDNVAIPTNLDVNPGAKKAFASFYAALLDKTLERHPRAVVTEYAWAAVNCDPCPDTPLSPGELATLGADVMGPGAREAQDFVLTRLHTRYRKDTLGEDLVFTQAPPITGGRETWGDDGQIEKGATRAGFNNFQARYTLRHPWGGAITCKNPQRGNWGDPPPGILPPSPTAALKLASAPRGNVRLDWMISPLSLATGMEGGKVLSTAKSAGAAPQGAPGPAAPAPAATPGAAPAAAQPAPAGPGAAAQPAAGAQPAAPGAGGCAGCRVGAGAGEAGALAAVGAAIAALWARRRAGRR